MKRLHEEISSPTPTNSIAGEPTTSPDIISPLSKRPKLEENRSNLKKRKCAIIAGYNGLDFIGSQINKGVRTVEEELEKSMHKAGLIRDSNYGELQKIKFSRATRTDKKVHAIMNIFAAKLEIDMSKESPINDSMKRLQNALPEDIRVFGLIEVSNKFDAKNCTSHREYDYYLPTFTFTRSKDMQYPQFMIDMCSKRYGEEQDNVETEKELTKEEDEKKKDGKESSGKKDKSIFEEGFNQEDSDKFYKVLYSYRISEENKAKLSELCECFVGTKKYHNYTRKIHAKDPSSNRYITEMKADEYYYIDGIEYVRFQLQGQSFLYNQIRKMIGCVVEVFRNDTDKTYIDNTFKDNTMSVAKAPGEGLMLYRVGYTLYNQRKQKKNEITITEEQMEDMDKFRKELIVHMAKSETMHKAYNYMFIG